MIWVRTWDSRRRASFTCVTLPVLCQLAGDCHMLHCLGEGEVVHSRIAQGQLKQLQKGDGTGGPVHDIENQQFQVQFILDESNGGHGTAPLEQVIDHFYYSRKEEKGQEKNCRLPHQNRAGT